MLIEISNKYRKSEMAADYLRRCQRRLPPFKLTGLRAHNGVVVEVPDDECEAFLDAVMAAGFDCEPDSPPEN